MVIDLSHYGAPVRASTDSSSTGRQNVAVASMTSVAPVVSSVGKPLSTSSRSAKPTSGRIMAISDEPAIRNSGDVQIKEETLSTQVRPVAVNSGGQVQNSISTASSKTSTTKSGSDSRIKPYQSESADSQSSSAPMRALASLAPIAQGGSGTVVIAIDAGHGGKDPGAIGQNGTYEKNVTLAVARELSAMINRQPGMRAVMTRTGDHFVDLDARSEIARQRGQRFGAWRLGLDPLQQACRS